MFKTCIVAALLPLLALGAPTVSKRAVSSVITANNGQCLGFTGSTDLADGTPVGNVDCGSSNVITWTFDVNTPTSLLASGSNFALDAGSNPGNFGKLKLWQSYPGLYQQTWWYTLDNRIAIYNGNQCLDDGNGLQTYQCTTGNTNQIFTNTGSSGGGGGGGGGGCSATVTVTETVTVTSGGSGPTTVVSSSSGPSTTTVVSSSSAPAEQFTSGGKYTITYKDCAPGGGGLGCEIQQPTPTAGEIVATVTLSA